MPKANAPTTYIQLAFMIDHHSLVSGCAYFGPPELNIESMTNAPPLELLDELATLIEQAIVADPDLTPERRRTYLETECRAMQTTIQILKGNGPGIVDEVRLLMGNSCLG